MKKFTVVLICLVLSVFIACSKDEPASAESLNRDKVYTESLNTLNSLKETMRESMTADGAIRETQHGFEVLEGDKVVGTFTLTKISDNKLSFIVNFVGDETSGAINSTALLTFHDDGKVDVYLSVTEDGKEPSTQNATTTVDELLKDLTSIITFNK